MDWSHSHWMSEIMYCIMESVDTAFLRSAAAATRRPFCAATI